MLKNKFVAPTILVFCLIALAFHLYKIDALCLNEDEAAQGYNTYSVLKTGKDEYGKLPIRFLSFGENKLPLTGFLSAPFIAIFGLNTQTVRIPTYTVGVLFPLLFYFATFSLTKNKGVALFAAFFSSTNIWLQTTSRHQHETVILSAIVLIYITVLFWKRPLPKKHIIILSILSFLGLYTYHSAKIVIPALTVATVCYVYFASIGSRAKKLRSAAITLLMLSVGILLFLSTELIVPNNRIGTLSYLTNPVLTYEIEEGRRMGGNKLFFNKPVYIAYKVVTRSAGYLLPNYLLFKSDPNPRYGASYVPLLSYFEYGFFICGALVSIYFLRKKQLSIYILFLYFFTFISVLPASLALPEYSSTRSYLLLIPVIIFMSLGTHFAFSLTKNCNKYLVAIPIIILMFHIFTLQSNWSKYFNGYLSDYVTKGAWQCGMDKVAKYAWQNYRKYKSINISSPFGQAYIYMLFYGGPFSPNNYQKIAKTMPYNEYGFWEQEAFDKFTFNKNIDCSPGTNKLNITISKEKPSKSFQGRVFDIEPSFSIYTFDCL